MFFFVINIILDCLDPYCYECSTENNKICISCGNETITNR